MADKIIVDEQVGLPYGFGFDEFIKKLRDTSKPKGGSEESSYTENLKKILVKLNYVDEEGLIRLYRETVAKKNSQNFRE